MISVVVPTYNEENFIEKCLLSLKNQSLPRHKYEVIVSDSSSTDNTVKIAKEHADKVVKCKKVSAGFGRNYGAKNSNGELLAFIDADTLASRNWLKGIKEGLSEAVACTGPVRALEKDVFYLRAFMRWWSFQSRASTLLGVPVFPGFNFSVRRKEFEEMNGFNSRDVTNEDLDLSLSLKKLGPVGFNSKMLVHTSTRRFREKSIFYNIKNAWNYILFKKSSQWKEHRADF